MNRLSIQLRSTGMRVGNPCEASPGKKGRSLTTSILLGSLLASSISACSLDGIVNVDEPEIGSRVEREALKSRDGAMGVYYSAVTNLTRAYSKHSFQTGTLTDELRDVSGITNGGNQTDIRRYSIVAGLKSLPLEGYSQLHAARVSASQSRHLLRTFSNETSTPFIANAYAIEGYAILLLAEALCSGFPITETPFEGEIQLSGPVSTDDAFRLAMHKFDSALAISHDSTRFTNLARVGKGRALLNLGEYSLAKEAVADVPSGFVYNLSYTQTNAPNSNVAEAFWTNTASTIQRNQHLGVGNAEGQNGLAWLSETPATQDARVPVTTALVGGVLNFSTPTRQNKFPTGNASVPLARDIDARLIEVEGLYQTGGDLWLAKINELRATRSLAPLSDPGESRAQVDLIFKERAFWNFLLGQRHGDLRRLIRQYGRNQVETFPVGTYHNIKGDFLVYGEAMVFTPLPTEIVENHKYEGCEHYDA